MNRKQLFILLVLLVVFGVAGLMVYRKQNQSTGSSSPLVGKKVIGDFPLNDIAQIVVQQGTNRVNLVKKDDRWRVQERDNYAANYSEISQFLIKLNDIKVVQTEEVGPSQLARLWLVPGTGTNTPTILEFRDASGKPLKTVLLGKKHMRKSARPSPMGDFGDEGYADGRYVLVGTNGTSVALISEAFANIEPKPDQWLNKDFFRLEKPRTISVQFQEPTNSWTLTRENETAQWTLVDAKPEEQLDSTKVSGVSNPFSSPSFNDLLVGVSPEEVGLDKPVTVKVDTFDHFAYTVRVGIKTNEAFPLMVNVDANLPKERTPVADEKPEDKEKLDKEFQEKLKKQQEKLDKEKAFADRIFLVSSWSVDSLLKERAQLLAQKTSPGDTNATPTDAHAAADPAAGQDEEPDLDSVLEPK